MVRKVKKTAFNRRFYRRIRALGLPQVAVANAMGWTQGQINHLVTGRIKMVKADAIFRLAEVLQCDPRWLAVGDDANTEETA